MELMAKKKTKKVSRYEDHAWMLEALKTAQSADHDNREHAREAHLFVDKRDGQWEPYWWDKNDGKPRYTFDLTNPIIDQISGDMEKSDYDIRVSPAGGDATKDIASTLDGLVRNIETISNAKDVYNRSGREMITCGLDGWRVTTKYVTGDSFDQDIVIEKVANYLDRAWHGPHEEPDGSDAKYAWVLTALDPDVFKEAYPDRNESGDIGDDRQANAYYYRNDLVVVGEFMYIKPESRELILMSNGAVYEDNEEYQKVKDELTQLGVVEERRRTRDKLSVYIRQFDLNGWIDDKPKITIFENWLPLVPTYANFKINEDKIIYWGVVEKLQDAQRVFNYSLSREIEEGALAPRSKYWLTEEEAAGYEESLRTMNTNADPVQFYNADPDTIQLGRPQQSGGAQVNPGLRNISQAMQQMVGTTQGMFAANMGDNPNLQSGVAIEALQDKGDQGNNKYLSARETSQSHTGRIIVNAIPRLYTPGRQVRLLNEDSSYEMVTIGEEVQDSQTGESVTLHDLSIGTYDVTCSFGPSFKNRQNETVTAITEVGKVDPSVIELGSDILLGNITSPGMDQIADRKRQQLFNNGLIPDDQLTEEEQQQKQAAADQPPPEDPMMVAAKAEEAKAQAETISAQTKQMEAKAEVELKRKQLEIDSFNAETNRFEAQVKHAQAMAEIKGKGAAAAKSLAEAEAQDLENDLTMSGVMGLVEKMQNG
jgi:hypothetical protein